jgi:hypothetical protein
MWRRALFVATAAGVGMVLAAPGAAAAQTAGQDSVSGTALACRQLEFGCSTGPPGDSGAYIRLTADARSGPRGESPSGTMTWDERFLGGLHHNSTQVSCMSVSGKVAIIGVSGTRTTLFSGGTFDSSIAGLIRVTDAGGSDSALDRFEFDVSARFPSQPPLPAPTDCSAFPAGLPAYANDQGDLAVTDALPPSTYAQCRLGGWIKYGYGTHAECITAVHEWARMKCIFERVAHGIVAFRAKYGFAPDQNHAMRHCVRLYTGF